MTILETVHLYFSETCTNPQEQLNFPGTLQSPNFGPNMYYPAGYPSINGLSCRWTLTAPFGQVKCSMLTRLSVVTFKGKL